MEKLLSEIRACTVCKSFLAHDPRPVVNASSLSKILIIGQAPGTKVHASGIPWDDASGVRLRDWMGLSEHLFYDPAICAIMPMGFCYPGKGKSGDLAPRPECAPLWHQALLDQMPNIQLVLLIGQYAQKYYLGDKVRKTLTQTVHDFESYLPSYIVLPHPSPRNNIWLKKNPWFEELVLPEFKSRIQQAIES